MESNTPENEKLWGHLVVGNTTVLSLSPHASVALGSLCYGSNFLWQSALHITASVPQCRASLPLLPHSNRAALSSKIHQSFQWTLIFWWKMNEVCVRHNIGCLNLFLINSGPHRSNVPECCVHAPFPHHLYGNAACSSNVAEWPFSIKCPYTRFFDECSFSSSLMRQCCLHSLAPTSGFTMALIYQVWAHQNFRLMDIFLIKHKAVPHVSQSSNWLTVVLIYGITLVKLSTS